MKLVYPAIFEHCSDYGEYYLVTIPDLDGISTEGETLEEAMGMAMDVASLWLLDKLENGSKIPKSSSLQQVRKELTMYKEEFFNYVYIDIEDYAKKYGKQMVKKNLTIPAWLNSLAEKHGINFSEVLREALVKKLKL